MPRSVKATSSQSLVTRNTYPLITPGPDSMFLDYLSATLSATPVDQALDIVESLFGAITPSGFQPSRYEYSGLILQGDGKVYWNGITRRSMVHVEIPAAALKILRESGVDSVPLLHGMLSSGFKMRRIDVTMDDHSGKLDMDVIAEAKATGDLSAKWEAENWETRTNSAVTWSNVRFRQGRIAHVLPDL